MIRTTTRSSITVKPSSARPATESRLVMRAPLVDGLGRQALDGTWNVHRAPGVAAHVPSDQPDGQWTSCTASDGAQRIGQCRWTAIARRDPGSREPAVSGSPAIRAGSGEDLERVGRRDDRLAQLAGVAVAGAIQRSAPVTE